MSRPYRRSVGTGKVPGIEFVLVLAAENDETRQTVSFLIACLVGIAIALAVLTVWYWFHTDPKRRREAVSPILDDAELLDPADEAGVENPVPDIPVTDPGAGDLPDPLDDVGPDVRPAEPAAHDEAEEFVTGPLMARQTWDFVAAAKRAEDGPTPRVSLPPAAPRIAVPQRGGSADEGSDETDELAVARRRRELEASRGLSDEVWDSVRRSVFDKLDS